MIAAVGTAWLLVAQGMAASASAEPPAADPALATEWTLRRRALAPATHAAELHSASASARWEERAAALAACTRGLEAGRELPERMEGRVAAGLGDPHASVRVAALDVLRARARPGALSAAACASLADDRLPAVRLALVQALERVGDPEAFLAALAVDADERVSRAALRAICGAPRPSPENVAAVAGLPAERLLSVARWLARTHAGGEVLAALRGGFRGQASGDRGWSALFEAVALARGEEGDVQRLLAGWLVHQTSPTARGLLLRASRSGDERLARAWLATLEALERRRDGEPTWADALAWPAFRDDLEALVAAAGAAAVSHLPLDLTTAVLDTLGPERTLALLLELEPSPGTLARFLPELGLRLRAWESSPWLDPEGTRRVREAAVEGLVATWSRTQDPRTARLLVGALDDPDPTIARRAFGGLCSPSSRAHLAPLALELHAAWKRFPEQTRRELLVRLPRVRLEPFRPEFLALGEEAIEERGVAAEHLAPFTGDTLVQGRVTAWLRDDLDRLAAEREPGPRRRGAELRVQGALRALARIDAEACVGEADEAARRSLGRSTEVGKVAVHVLGMTSSGRVRLAAYLGPEIDRRTRIEAAIWLALLEDGADERPVLVLIEEYAHAAWDLRARMLPAIAAPRSPRALAFLGRLALDDGAQEEDRRTALGLLAHFGTPQALAVLESAWRVARHFEVRRQALRQLGVAGGDVARGLLVEAYEVHRSEPADTPERQLEKSLLRGEVLAALARSGGLPERLEAEWLRAPLERSAHDLAARFRGDTLPAIGFAWRAELEVASALATLGPDRTSALLAAAGPWWRLDGRLLVALAGGLRVPAGAAGSPAANLLGRAGLVALLGERAPPTEELGRARLRLLEALRAERRWAALARAAESVLVEYRAGRLTASVWSAGLGAFDRRQEVDPLARLESLVWQARAQAALSEAGRSSGERRAEHLRAAHRNLSEAEPRLGVSGVARAEQTRLRSALTALEPNR